MKVSTGKLMMVDSVEKNPGIAQGQKLQLVQTDSGIRIAFSGGLLEGTRGDWESIFFHEQPNDELQAKIFIDDLPVLWTIQASDRGIRASGAWQRKPIPHEAPGVWTAVDTGPPETE